MACRVDVRGLRVNMGKRTIVEVDNLDFGPGGLHFIIGPNGAGKTTLLRAILGMISYEGSIQVCGSTPWRVRRMISYVPASIEVDRWARVGEVFKAVAYGSWHYSLKGLPGRLGIIREWLHRRFGELSSGEQRLVLIGAALSRRPKLVIADEPLSFLDVGNQFTILEIFREASYDMTVVMTTHELMYVGYADTVTLVSRGRIVYHGAPTGLDDRLVENVYGVDFISIDVDGITYFIPKSRLRRSVNAS